MQSQKQNTRISSATYCRTFGFDFKRSLSIGDAQYQLEKFLSSLLYEKGNKTSGYSVKYTLLLSRSGTMLSTSELKINDIWDLDQKTHVQGEMIDM